MKHKSYIVMTQWVAPKGAAFLIYKNKKELNKRYPSYLIEETYRITKDIYKASGIGHHRDLGLYDLLWELGEVWDTGFTVYADRLPLMQMLVEICGYLGEDIFELSMGGSQIIICDNPYEVIDSLDGEGVKATVIGHFTDKRDRVIVDGERTTFITPSHRRKHQGGH